MRCFIIASFSLYSTQSGISQYLLRKRQMRRSIQYYGSRAGLPANQAICFLFSVEVMCLCVHVHLDPKRFSPSKLGVLWKNQGNLGEPIKSERREARILNWPRAPRRLVDRQRSFRNTQPLIAFGPCSDCIPRPRVCSTEPLQVRNSKRRPRWLVCINQGLTKLS